MKRCLLLVAAVLLAACSSGPSEGHVVAKQVIAAHDESYPIFTTICMGNPLVCHQQYIGQGTQHYDTDWQVELDNSGDRGWVSVTHSVYVHLSLGDFWRQP